MQKSNATVTALSARVPRHEHISHHLVLPLPFCLLLPQSQSGEEVGNDSSEQLLLRWMNLHLKRANYSKEVTNFSSDLKVGPGFTQREGFDMPVYVQIAR